MTSEAGLHERANVCDNFGTALCLFEQTLELDSDLRDHTDAGSQVLVFHCENINMEGSEVTRPVQ